MVIYNSFNVFTETNYALSIILEIFLSCINAYPTGFDEGMDLKGFIPKNIE
jgi:hypothetical protein